MEFNVTKQNLLVDVKAANDIWKKKQHVNFYIFVSGYTMTFFA